MRNMVPLLMQQMRQRPTQRAKPLRHGAPAGTYCCFVRTVSYWAGPRAGDTEQLEGGEWELDIITDQNLLWEYEDANSVHNGLPLTIRYRPNGADQLVAHTADLGLVLRIALMDDPEHVPMPFTALGAQVALTGICYFKPRGS